MEPLLRLEKLCKRFGDNVVLRDLNLDVRRGEFLAIFGKSGSGKSVLLRTIIGLERADSGKVLLEGKDLTKLSERELQPIRRRVALVFQGGALFDSLTVFDNIAYPLREASADSLDDAEVRKRVEAKLQTVGLEGAQDKYPAELSGGMKKRVALARGLVNDPSILLYDEPTAGLDPVNVARVNDLMDRVRRTLSVTSIAATHDLDSAFAVADRIALLSGGRIVEIAEPERFRLSDHPAVREFLESDPRQRRRA